MKKHTAPTAEEIAAIKYQKDLDRLKRDREVLLVNIRSYQRDAKKFGFDPVELPHMKEEARELMKQIVELKKS